jgi:3-oxoacyl-[acyl-carrier protein] reductase
MNLGKIWWLIEKKIQIGGIKVATGDFGLAGKNVLITGASKGLGRSCAEAFAGLGANLLLAARTEDKLVSLAQSLENSEAHQVCASDLTTMEGIQRLVEDADAFGEIDVVLHVMGGGLGMREPLLEWDQFDALFKTNLSSAAELNRALVPRMVERKTGNIVHVGSIASSEAVGSVGYNTIKAALAAYTRTLGRALADSGVIVTAILPGGFWAPENSFVRLKERDPAVFEKWVEEHLPRKQLGKAEEIIPLMFFLSSRQATMMTGCCVPIDGGEGLTYV